MEIKKVKPYIKNAKKHPDGQLKQIAKSIKAFGWQQPIVTDKNNEIIVGHGRWFAYEKYGKEMNLPKPEIKQASNLTKQQVKAYRLADNKLNESDWDMVLAIEDLKELDDYHFDLTGFDKDLLIELYEKDDDIPDNAPAICKLGDIWQLGKHRIMCADSTKGKNVKKLMGEKKARVLFTSPPYNMGGKMYENYEDNLKSEEYIDFNIKVVDEWKEYLFGFLFWNISYNKKSRWEFIEILYRIIKETGLKFLELVVWNKKHAMPIMSKEMMTRQYENILVAGNDEEAGVDQELEMAGLLRNDKKAYFNRKTKRWLSNYWEVNVNKVQLEKHQACYPVALPVKAILIMSEEKDIISDPFLGSGSTLIAAEKTNRICYGMEIDSKYCDVIIARFEKFSGKKAKKLAK